MDILILTNHFYPEEFRCNDIAFTMAKRGHKVKVLTAIPDYPQGKYHKGYSLFKKRHETIDGVKVIRVPVIPRGKGGKIRMVLNYMSSLIMTMIYSTYQALFHKYDCIYIHDTSPAFICLPAVWIKKIRKTPIVLWILDMWPESLVAGGIKGGSVYNSVQKMMRMIYRNSDKIQISSHGFEKKLNDQGVPSEKIEYFPNWSDDALTKSEKVKIDELPEGFKIMFAGNLGEAQNLENVLHAAKGLKSNEDIKWIFLGDGRKMPWIENFIKEEGLENNVYMLGRHQMEEMPNYFEKADVMLVSLCDQEVFNNTLPAKVQAYMSCKKPIIAFLNGEGQTIINKAKCGIAVDANDIEGLQQAILMLKSMGKNGLSLLGENAYKFYQENFNKEKLMDQLEHTLNDTINAK